MAVSERATLGNEMLLKDWSSCSTSCGDGHSSRTRMAVASKTSLQVACSTNHYYSILIPIFRIMTKVKTEKMYGGKAIFACAFQFVSAISSLARTANQRHSFIVAKRGLCWRDSTRSRL